MTSLKRHEIPSNIESLEFEDDQSEMCDFKKLAQESRKDVTAYYEAHSAFIYMEEAANSTSMRAFNMENIQIALQSHNDHVFKIEYNVSCII